LIDGLQRISTILEFMGLLREPESSTTRAPSVLTATKYLPSLSNVVWERSDRTKEVPEDNQVSLDKQHQLAIRRARIGVEILKRTSDNDTKYDFFQRLNAGGTPANAQELRNCIIIMVDASYFTFLKTLAENTDFQRVISATEDQLERQRHMEWATRFLVQNYCEYDGKLDVEEYIDEGIVQLTSQGESAAQRERFESTFAILNRA
jgi:transcriptional regulator of heat shock response